MNKKYAIVELYGKYGITSDRHLTEVLNLEELKELNIKISEFLENN